MIATAAVGLVGQIIGMFGKAGEAKAEALKQVAGNMQRTWVDELLVLYWFLPSFLAWFGYVTPLDAQIAMISAEGKLFEIQVGVSLAVFGLNKFNGKR